MNLINFENLKFNQYPVDIAYMEKFDKIYLEHIAISIYSSVMCVMKSQINEFQEEIPGFSSEDFEKWATFNVLYEVVIRLMKELIKDKGIDEITAFSELFNSDLGAYINEIISNSKEK